MERQKKPVRRRSYSRKLAQDCVINTAEARKEIAHALQLHRSSSSSSKTISASSSSCVVAERETSGVGISCCNYVMSRSYMTASQYCCYSLMEAIPLPEPVWSTTAPSIPAAPPAMEAVEFEWGENQDSSYAWWLGFLKSLDGNNIEVEESKHPCGEHTAMKRNSWVFGHQESSKLGGPGFWNIGSDHQQNSCLDDWLMFPTTEDQEETVTP